MIDGLSGKPNFDALVNFRLCGPFVVWSPSLGEVSFLEVVIIYFFVQNYRKSIYPSVGTPVYLVADTQEEPSVLLNCTAFKEVEKVCKVWIRLYGASS